MRKQYHFRQFGSDTYIWDVDRLVRLSQDLPTHFVNIDSIPDFDENYWYEFDEKVPTPRSICDHIKLVQATDLFYPIILNADGHVMDGMHRICKAYLQGKSSLLAKQFAVQPEPDYINKKFSELDY